VIILGLDLAIPVHREVVWAETAARPKTTNKSLKIIPKDVECIRKKKLKRASKRFSIK
jgi:hypothetical protein